MSALILAIVLVQFTGPTGHRLDINAAEVTSIREIEDAGHWGAGSHCILVMSNGRFLAVRETCEQTRRALGGTVSAPQQGPCVMVCGANRETTKVQTR